MSTQYWSAPLIFLLDTLFSLYIFCLLLRFLFQWCGADYQNPLSQFLIRMTHPPLSLLRRFIPAMGRVDSSALVLILLLQILEGFLIFLIQGGMPSFSVLSIWSITQLIELTLNIYFYAIIIRALLSWVGPSVYNPAISLLFSLTEPVMATSRRLLPITGGIDLSPIVVIMAIQLIRMLILPPLQNLALVLN
ncbi:MAG: YggT family protein [Methylococcus sp.]|nr:MAG: YggT family protein [Methylococcus sp.]